MEWSIGEIRQIDGEWYQCIESYFSCEGCDFKNTSKCSHEGVECSFPVRQDYISVIFKKLEKIGEPYDDCGTILQRFKIYTNVTNANTKGLELHIYSNDTIGIEIKQSKEYMEEQHTTENYPTKEEKIAEKIANKVGENIQNQLEKDMNKLNLKTFNLEAAKAGKPVCTRDGCKARIICFDKKDCKRIVALVQVNNETEVLYDYYNDGSVFHSDSDNDLMMLPEKRSGWINVKKDAGLFKSREEAERNCTEDYAPVMVEFEI